MPERTFDAKLADAGGRHEGRETEHRIHAQGVTFFHLEKGIGRTARPRSWRRDLRGGV